MLSNVQVESDYMKDEEYGDVTSSLELAAVRPSGYTACLALVVKANSSSYAYRSDCQKCPDMSNS